MERRELLTQGGKLLATAAFGSLAGSGRAGAVKPAVPTDPVTDLSGLELSRAIAARKVSCREVMVAFLDRIEKVNPGFNAIVLLRDRGELLAQADAADAALHRGETTGPLHGFPLAPKDAVRTRGLATTNGLPLANFKPESSDGLLAERMRRAGGIFIGKTNMPELGLGSQTYNDVFGTTLNAWNPQLTAGGSSGGAAVAIAQRMLPLADGSDMMGSLRNPAGWNNIVALRPSTGRVPMWPTADVFGYLATEGPMGRNTADVAFLLSVLAGQDPRLPLSLGDNPAKFAGSLERSFKGARIGWLGDLEGYLPTEPGVLEICRSALKHFESAGCTVDSAKAGFNMAKAWDSWVTLRSHTLSTFAAPLYKNPETRKRIKPEAQWEIETGLSVTSERMSSAMIDRNGWFLAVNRLFDDFDFLILPTAQVFPFDAKTHWPTRVGGREMDTYHRWMEVASVGTMTGLPIGAVPAGFASDRRAMGLQIIGPAKSDFAVLQLASAYEQASGFARLRPDA
ncbi:MAG: amidase [Proteobacteria bacterium]|nr:amidase [Pseudomonadota bacterium]